MPEKDFRGKTVEWLREQKTEAIRHEKENTRRLLFSSEWLGDYVWVPAVRYVSSVTKEKNLREEMLCDCSSF